MIEKCRGGWVLDICLDYFGTHNPFAFILERQLGGELVLVEGFNERFDPQPEVDGEESGSFF